MTRYTRKMKKEDTVEGREENERERGRGQDRENERG